jgi:Nuclear pore complex scaffold, nucleoporins 186/192/205
MVLLLRIAETKVGADRLIEYGIFERLVDSQYLDQQPSFDGGHHGEVLANNLNEKFYSITNSAFELISSIISHYSPEQITVTKKVFHV